MLNIFKNHSRNVAKNASNGIQISINNNATDSRAYVKPTIQTYSMMVEHGFAGSNISFEPEAAVRTESYIMSTAFGVTNN